MLKFIGKILLDLFKLIVAVAIFLMVLKVLNCNICINTSANNIKDFITVTRNINTEEAIPVVEEGTEGEAITEEVTE